MAFTHQLRVRYAEVDAQGVVFNAHWLTYLDEAMTRFFDHLGYDPKETWIGEDAPFDVMLVRSEIEWRGPVGFEDVVAIEVAPARLGTSSFDLAFTARLEGEVVLEARTTYVSIVPGEGTSQPIPDDVRQRLEDAGG